MIEVKNLTKVYGDHTAVNHLNFHVEAGHIYGFLGVNGAGKSTTMNMLTGCLAATEGTVRIDGHDIFEEPTEAKRCIGYLPELPPLYPEMTPREYLYFVGRAKGLSKGECSEQIDEVLKITQLMSVQNRLIRNLSKGYRQRVGIAQALLGHPKIIILDEPTVGLDPKQIIDIRDLIRSLGRDHTVILSSHILSEISEVCDYVMILSHGNLVASDTLEHLTHTLTGDRTVELLVRAPEGNLRMALNEIPGITSYEISPTEEPGVFSAAIGSARDTDLRDALFFKMAELRYPILEMSSRVVTLEDVFLRLTADAEEHTDDGFRRKTTFTAPQNSDIPDRNANVKAAKEGTPEAVKPHAVSPADKNTRAKQSSGKKEESEYTPLFRRE